MSNHSEVVVTPDGRMYHLGIAPDEIARCLFLVGDPDRAYRVARRFEQVDHEARNRGVSLPELRRAGQGKRTAREWADD